MDDSTKIYIDGTALPYVYAGFTEGLNDVDLDAYTNLGGYTVRNRVREDVRTFDFTFPIMNGTELHTLLNLVKKEWFQVTFFDEKDWAMVTKKMYCSAKTYNKYYIDPNPENNLYEDITFSFVEE